jgi:hypothetical protein
MRNFPEELYKINGFSFKAVELPQIKELPSKEYVYYGERNNFPDKVIELYETSAINATAINAIRDAVIGEGILNFGEEYVNSDGETINEIFEKIALDYVMFGGYSLNLLWNKEATRITEIYHLPFANVRSGKKNEEGNVTHYFYSDNWNDLRKNPYNEYRAFNVGDNKKENASQIFYYMNYQPGQRYYPLPDYWSAGTDIDLDARISRYHNASLQNGISPNLFIKFRNGIPSEDERREIHRSIQATFSGEENAGQAFISFSRPGEEMEVEAIPQTNDGLFTVLEQRITSRILTSHRASSPLLVGIKDASGFSNNADEIETAFAHFMATVVKPKQKKILSTFNYILKFHGMTVNLEVEPQRILIENVKAVDTSNL